MNTKILALVTAALAPTEAVLRAEYARQLTAQHDKLVKDLTEDGWDARKRYDYPSSSFGSRMAYQGQVARYNLCNKYTQSVKSTLSQSEPRIVVLKANNGQVIAAEAAKMAKAALEGYCAKLAGKIDKAPMGGFADDIRYSGGANPWGYSYVTVYVGSKQVQQWKTKMIVNVSCLGKLFNQWPTTWVK